MSVCLFAVYCNDKIYKRAEEESVFIITYYADIDIYFKQLKYLSQIYSLKKSFAGTLQQ